jgi:tetratricopeptide (TPR) repeat protein
MMPVRARLVWYTIRYLVALTCALWVAFVYHVEPSAAGNDWIGLTAISPSVRTGIQAGQSYTLQATVPYRLESAAEGVVVLFIFENDNSESIEQTSAPISVKRGSGQVTPVIQYTPPRAGVYKISFMVALFRDRQSILASAGGGPVPVNPPEDYLAYVQAVNAFNSGNYREALNGFSRAIELYPGMRDYYHWRADTYVQLQNYEAAIADYTRALEIIPNYRAGLVARAIARMWLYDWTNAVVDFSAAIDQGARDQWTAWAHRGRGISLAALGRREEAIADYQAYLELTPQADDRELIQSWIAALQEGASSG